MQTLFTQEILLHWQAWLRAMVMILISSLLAVAGHALVWASARRITRHADIQLSGNPVGGCKRPARESRFGWPPA